VSYTRVDAEKPPQKSNTPDATTPPGRVTLHFSDDLIELGDNIEN
jgi:hypothetical protein